MNFPFVFVVEIYVREMYIYNVMSMSSIIIYNSPLSFCFIPIIVLLICTYTWPLSILTFDLSLLQ